MGRESLLLLDNLLSFLLLGSKSRQRAESCWLRLCLHSHGSTRQLAKSLQLRLPFVFGARIEKVVHGALPSSSLALLATLLRT